MISRIYRQISYRVRWRLGLRVAAAELEAGDVAGVRQFYQGRVTDCRFLSDPDHYERPRVQWILDQIRGGRLLEIGCGNGGMTRLLAPLVAELVALDVSTPSLAEVAKLGLPNVRTVEALLEDYRPECTFDWIVLSEVLEHVRNPQQVVRQLVRCLAPGGSLLITTPNGHWESNEHLQEFSIESFAQVVAAAGAEAVSVTHLRDAMGRRRWLAGQITAPVTPPARDDFNNRRTVARRRRLIKR
jgi:2-polyprenyl-3-methyl-5-hydroxy-6-metoxy-1,4-benzoquinol methylase